MIHCYKILEGQSVDDLEDMVRHAVKNGYEPIGGVSVAVWQCENCNGHTENHTGYFQAIVPRRL